MKTKEYENYIWPLHPSTPPVNPLPTPLTPIIDREEEDLVDIYKKNMEVE